MSSSRPSAAWQRLRSVLDQAQRRGVHRALTVYGAVVWGAVAAAPDLIQYLDAPPWTFRALLLVLLIGVPIVAVGSWKLSVVIRPEDAGAPGSPAPEVAETPSGGADASTVGVGGPETPPAPPPTDGRRALRWGVPVLLLLTFPFLFLWGVSEGADGRITVALAGAVEGPALLQPMEWLLGADVVALPTTDPLPLSGALEQARQAGAAYLVHRTGSGDAVTFALYDAATEERIGTHAAAPGERADPGPMPLRLAVVIAEREGARLAVEPDIVQQATSPVALSHLLEGQRRFGAADFDGAAAALHLAIEADSGFLPAYYRLAVVERWRWDYSAGWDILTSALARSNITPRWGRLMEAQRRYLERNAAETLAGFEETTLHNPELIEGWLGLGEALFHYGGFLGHDPQAAWRPFERALEVDSAVAPIGHHMAELALWRGDGPATRDALAGIAQDHPVREMVVVAEALEFGGQRRREEAWQQARAMDLRLLSLLVGHFGLRSGGAPLADSLAAIMLDPARRPEERLRGAQYRLILAPDEASWERAIRDWREVRGVRPFDPWAMHAAQGGRPVAEAADMLAWAERQRVEGAIPDFSLTLNHELRRAFNALVHDAVLHGDSTRVAELLDAMDGAEEAHPADPGPQVLGAALRARWALLAADTATALDELATATSRTFEPFVTFYPASTMAPERLLLIRLLDAAGRSAEADRWRASFRNSLSFGDLLYRTWALDGGKVTISPTEGVPRV